MNRTMLAVYKDAPVSGVVVRQTQIPIAKDDEILVKVRASSICGTDISIYDWTPWAAGHITPPMVMGHELVGEILEINGDPGALCGSGDLVSSETHIFCGHCYQCQIGNRHICENMELFGIGRDGGFAEYATIPIRTTWKNDPSLDPEVMCAQEPLGNAVHVVTKGDVPGKTVLVLGLGPVGLSAVAVAKAYGAKRVIGVNRRRIPARPRAPDGRRRGPRIAPARARRRRPTSSSRCRATSTRSRTPFGPRGSPAASCSSASRREPASIDIGK